MIDNLRQAIRGIRIGEPVAQENLRLFPLYPETLSDLAYRVLDPESCRELVDIEEVSAAGSVPEMQVRNKAGELLFIPDGAILVGSRQNRVVNLSMLLAPNSVAVMPVSCVERGRWHYTMEKSSPAEHGDFMLRKIMHSEASESLRRSRKVQVDQGKVWAHVEGAMACARVSSPTADYKKVYDEWNEKIAACESSLRLPGDACGAAVEVDGKIEIVDVFDKPETFRKLWPTLARSYILSALGRFGSKQERGESGDPQKVLFAAGEGKAEEYRTGGCGKTLILTGPGVRGAALLHEDRLVHLALFTGYGNAPGE